MECNHIRENKNVVHELDHWAGWSSCGRCTYVEFYTSGRHTTYNYKSHYDNQKKLYQPLSLQALARKQCWPIEKTIPLHTRRLLSGRDNPLCGYYIDREEFRDIEWKRWQKSLCK